MQTYIIRYFSPFGKSKSEMEDTDTQTSKLKYYATQFMTKLALHVSIRTDVENSFVEWIGLRTYVYQ